MGAEAWMLTLVGALICCAWVVAMRCAWVLLLRTFCVGNSLVLQRVSSLVPLYWLCDVLQYGTMLNKI